MNIQHNDIKLLDSCFNNQLKYVHHQFEQRTYRFTRLKPHESIKRNLLLFNKIKKYEQMFLNELKTKTYF